MSQVCLVGNLCIDLIIRDVPHLPEWGREVAGSGYVQVSSGQTTYTAFALRSLGVPVKVIGCVGDDHWGRQILGDLAERGIDTRAVEVARYGKTAITVAIVRRDGERAFVSDFACLNETDESVILRQWEQIDGSDLVCLLGVFSFPGIDLARAAELFQRMRREGKTTVLDTGWDPGGWSGRTRKALRKLLNHISIFLPNLDEARTITGCEDPEGAARRLQEEGPELVVIKLGKEGSFARFRELSAHQPALPAQVVDTVGAGDVHNAGFLFAFRKGWPLEACMSFGNAAAALYISRPRDRFPGAEEVHALAGRHRKEQP